MADQKRRRFFPLAIDLAGRPCVVVGGGAVGTRKALTLVEAGAEVTVVAPAASDGVVRAAQRGRLRWVRSGFQQDQIEGAFLVVAATDDEAINAEVAQVAAERGALVCDASSAARSQVIFGALLESGPVTVAVFTGGQAPAVARRTRDQIARFLASSADCSGGKRGGRLSAGDS